MRTKAKVGRPAAVLPASLMKYFQNYRWPGNIRELENVIERVVVLSRSDEITVEDLPDFLRQEHVSVDTLQLDLPPQGVSLEAVEKELIERALKKFNGNQTHTAKYLDISRKALMYRMEKHGIRRAGQPATEGELEDEDDSG
jgi:two-component system NtrC family response regulator